MVFHPCSTAEGKSSLLVPFPEVRSCSLDAGVYDLLLRSEGYLQELFHYYALLSLPHDRICFVDFRRLVRDFRILTLISMQAGTDLIGPTMLGSGS